MLNADLDLIIEAIAHGIVGEQRSRADRLSVQRPSLNITACARVRRDVRRLFHVDHKCRSTPSCAVTSSVVFQHLS
jgi:hypothetical protein